jgi:hypothetical protein
MMISQNRTSGFHLDMAGKVLTAALHSWTRGAPDTPAGAPRVFVTVSREPGAGAISFSHRLAERLNGAGADDWSAWDRELIDRVSAEHGISTELLERIPDRHRGWLTSLVDGMSNRSPLPEFAELRAYKRVVLAIRALAERGHAIIVGQGGTFVTEHMPGSIHLRLVAPLAHRIKHTADREKLSLRDAAARVADADAHRAEFFRRFWHRKTIAPDCFTMTLNSGDLSIHEMVEAVLPVVRIREAALASRKSPDVSLHLVAEGAFP